MSDVFEALAAPARRAILDELCKRDGQTLFELCGRLTMTHGLGLTRQAISQHLDVLESAGLIRTERQGRYKFHFIDTRPLSAIVARWPPGSPPEAPRKSSGRGPEANGPGAGAGEAHAGAGSEAGRGKGKKR